MSQKITNSPNQPLLNAPFRFKSAGVSLVTLLTIGSYYIANLLALLPGGETVPDGALHLTITTVVLIVIVEAALQIVLFIGAGQIEKSSERDNAIAAQASGNAYRVLTVGVFASVGSVFAGFTAFETSSLLLVTFVLAEIVKFASQLVYYKRSA